MNTGYPADRPRCQLSGAPENGAVASGSSVRMPRIDVMEIEVEHQVPSGARIVRARGELDLAAAERLLTGG
jgi:hypothetical protein